MQKKIFYFFLLLIFIIFFSFIFEDFNNSQFKNYDYKKFKVGNKTYKLYVADTQEKRVRGLSYTEKINSNEGMIFLFDKAQIHNFWMKDMNYDLDIIFLRKNVVTKIYNQVNFQSYPEKFSSQTETDMVIELNSGEVEQNKLKIGDSVREIK